MNEQEQRIAIAEACGWTVVSDTICNVYPNLSTGEPELEPVAEMPDYLNDLNAMHEAEKVLTEKKLKRYAHEMIGYARRAAGYENHESHYPVPFVLRATAAQRAEAFLKTLNLWTD